MSWKEILIMSAIVLVVGIGANLIGNCIDRKILEAKAG